MATRPTGKKEDLQIRLMQSFCRLQVPGLDLSDDAFSRHLQRSYAVYQAKQANGCTWESYLGSLHWLDWYVAVGCLEGIPTAWERLFASRAGKTDFLLVDALRARSVRLYPRDEEKQERAVSEFWGLLLAGDRPESSGILGRYDGQRPLVPWLIRVFQNWHVSQLRQRKTSWQTLPEDDLLHPLPATSNARWHEAFCLAARESLRDLADQELLILGLRLRYRLSQREVAGLLGLHEGTISRQTTLLRDRCLNAISHRLLAEGWQGDDLSGFVLSEMESLLLDEPRLSADNLARLLSVRGKRLPGA